MSTNRTTGQYGEDLACDHYVACGYKILDRNVRITRVGEIDVIACIVNNTKPMYVFVEVKTRTSTRCGEGFEAISFQKRIRMRTCALAWLAENTPEVGQRYEWRLDVVSIALEAKIADITVFENIEI